MTTISQNTENGQYTQATNANGTVTTHDADGDGVVDSILVQEANGNQIADGWINVGSAEDFAQLNELLQQHMGMQIFGAVDGNDAPLNFEGVFNLDGTTQVIFDNIVSGVTSGVTLPELQDQWADLVTKMVGAGSIDINALVLLVLRESYLEITKDLHHFAQKVKFYNDSKEAIRDRLTEMRKLLGDQAGREDGDPLVGGSVSEQMFDATPIWNDQTNSFEASGWVADGQITNKEELEQYIANLEEQQSTVGQDQQLANATLQNAVQQQQNALQMMSTLSKVFNDTARAVIRNIGG